MTTAKNTKRAAPVAPRAPRRKPVGIVPDDTLGGACSRTLLGLATALEQHARAVHKGDRDPEALHRLRVTTRRLLAAFDVFEGALNARKAGRHVGWLTAVAEASGAVRDLDVLAASIRSHAASLADGAIVAPLLQRVERLDGEARAKLDAFLADDAFADGLRRLQAAAAADSGLYRKRRSTRRVRFALPARLHEILADTREAAPAFAETDVAKLHELRLAAKGLRYAIECLHDLLGEEGERLAADVRAVQDHLGAIEDADRAIRTVGELLAGRNVRAPGKPSRAAAAEFVRVAEQRKAEGLAGWVEVWARVDSTEGRVRFGTALARI